jgi:NAD(P)-dependent dehydrogenase (short-subunit alcohol dehydrogenase family)
MQFRDKVALVTGAGSGIGRAAALRFASEGATVGVLSRTKHEVERTAHEIEAAGGEALALHADVSQPEQMESAVNLLVERFGRLDIVFANAGINGVWAPLEDITPEEWDRTLSINLKGTFLTVKYAVPHMKARGGAIIVTSSVNGTRIFSNTGATAYSVSKAGQVAFVKMTAIELARYNIRINAICPGAVSTEIDSSTERRNVESVQMKVEYRDGYVPLSNKPATPDQIANVALFLASDAASYVTGTELWVDGAISLLVG